MTKIELTAKVTMRKPKIWKGFYGRIPGYSSTFHVKWINRQHIPIIALETDDGQLNCPVIGEVANSLAEAVNEGKIFLTGGKCGSFLINEFGQIIVPDSDKGLVRAYVGDVTGILKFENPDNGEVFDLADDSKLRCGDKWIYPYVGSVFQCSKRNIIYRVWSSNDESLTVPAPKQDRDLIQKIQRTRQGQGARLIVTPNGLVLTKKQIGNMTWQPTYVGKINRSEWFYKET